MIPTCLGATPGYARIPDAFVTVSKDDMPHIRIELYADHSQESLCFQEVQLWNDYVAIGFGERLYLVSLKDRSSSSFDLGCYFGHLYCTKKHLLVASAERLFCLDLNGKLHWTSEPLGIDGVIVHRVEMDIVFGEGEWDPPGGWEPFQVQLCNGVLLKF